MPKRPPARAFLLAAKWSGATFWGRGSWAGGASSSKQVAHKGRVKAARELRMTTSWLFRAALDGSRAPLLPSIVARQRRSRDPVGVEHPSPRHDSRMPEAASLIRRVLCLPFVLALAGVATAQD